MLLIADNVVPTTLNFDILTSTYSYNSYNSSLQKLGKLVPSINWPRMLTKVKQIVLLLNSLYYSNLCYEFAGRLLSHP